VKADRGLSIERMVELRRVSRSGFYRHQRAEPRPNLDMELGTRCTKSPSSGPATDARV
jgi:hypothetical protein